MRCCERLPTDDVVVRALFSGISRGTEALVFAAACRKASGRGCARRFRRASFPRPVKYGYTNVGRVEGGPAELTGRTVFALCTAPDALRRAGVGGARVAGGRAARAEPCSPPTWRPR